MPQLASITVSGGGGGGDVQGEMLEELRKINDALETGVREGKKSSILGGLTGGGLFARLLGGLGAGTLGIAGLGALSLSGGTSEGNVVPDEFKGTGKNFFSYEKALVDGEEMVIEINEGTGRIQRFLTVREAQEQGILDETKKFRNHITSNNTTLDDIGKTLPKYKDQYVLSLKTMKDITGEEDYQKSLIQDINKELEKKLLSLGGRVSEVNANFSSEKFGDINVNPAGERTYGVPASFELSSVLAKSNRQQQNEQLASFERNMSDRAPLFTPSFYSGGSR